MSKNDGPDGRQTFGSAYVFGPYRVVVFAQGPRCSEGRAQIGRRSDPEQFEVPGIMYNNSDMPIRILEAPESPWGDYGDILRHGMAAPMEGSVEGLIELERTGPFIPPISFPESEIVVTDTWRERLEGSGLKGLAFNPIRKTRIVELAWHMWDPAADDPAEYPESGEPEDYILNRAHSPALAEAMGPLWQLVLTEGAETERESTDSWADVRIYLKMATWTGADIFRARGVGYVFASDRAQAWLSRELGEHVAFRDCLLR